MSIPVKLCSLGVRLKAQYEYGATKGGCTPPSMWYCMIFRPVGAVRFLGGKRGFDILAHIVLERQVACAETFIVCSQGALGLALLNS